jgi:pseudomonalisin
LIDQKLGSRQGNINPLLYALANGSSAASMFNDITVGTNAMPCIVETGVTGCTVTGISNPTPTTVGLLSGYNATAGFDLATGLGSVNIGNLVNGAAPSFYLSSSNPVVTIASPGASGTLNVTAYPVNGYTGTVNLACSNLPTAATCTFSPTSVVFTSSTSATTGIPVVVTVNTTSASMTSPANRPGTPLGWVLASTVSLGLAMLLTMMFAGSQRRQFGWSMAGLLLALSLVTAIAACGGGSSSTTTTTTTTTTTGTTGNTSAVLTGTASGGSPTSSMNFTVTIQ